MEIKDQPFKKQRKIDREIDLFIDDINTRRRNTKIKKTKKRQKFEKYHQMKVKKPIQYKKSTMNFFSKKNMKFKQKSKLIKK